MQKLFLEYNLTKPKQEKNKNYKYPSYKNPKLNIIKFYLAQILKIHIKRACNSIPGRGMCEDLEVQEIAWYLWGTASDSEDQ